MIWEAVVTIFVLYFSVKLYKNAYERPENFPPGPPRLPIWGSYWIILAHGLYDLGSAFNKLAKKYKTKIIGQYLGPFPAIVIDDPDLIKEMLYREEFDGRMDILLGRLRSYWKRLGIFFTDGYFWHIQRRFSLRYLRDFGFGRRDETLEAVVASEIKEMIDLRMNGPRNAAEKNIVNGDLVFLPHYFEVPFINGMLHVFSKMTVPRQDYHVLWDMVSHGLIFQRNSDDMGRALCITPWLKDVIPNWSGFSGLMKGNQYFIKFYTKLVNDVLETHDEKHDRHFLDVYIRKMKEEQRNGSRSTYSVEQLVLICTDYTFPAATALGVVLMMLMEKLLLKPEIQDKIHEEIDRVVGRDRLPTLDDRKNMPYTEACIRETMRYDTLLPLGLPHRAVTETKLGGYTIPQDCFVGANFTKLNMDKNIWGDPENFRPERFIVDGQLCVAKDKTLPFGAGKRLCAGETYARQTMFQLFAGFMQAFNVSTADGRPLTKPYPRIPGIIITLPELWLKVTPRT